MDGLIHKYKVGLNYKNLIYFRIIPKGGKTKKTENIDYVTNKYYVMKMILKLLNYSNISMGGYRI